MTPTPLVALIPQSPPGLAEIRREVPIKLAQKRAARRRDKTTTQTKSRALMHPNPAIPHPHRLSFQTCHLRSRQGLRSWIGWRLRTKASDTWAVLLIRSSANTSVATELLRSYRLAHSRIEPFERALRENTPLSSIKDPTAFVEYLNQLNLKSDMVVDELKRVSAEKDSLKKKYEEVDEELVALKYEISTRPVEQNRDGGEDMFSYDDEIPKLQAALRSQTEENAKLAAQISTLNEELAAAKGTRQDDVMTLEASSEGNGSSDAAALVLTQLQLDSRDAEIKSLKDALEQKEKQLLDMEAMGEKERSLHASSLAEKKSEVDQQEILINEHKTANEQLSKDLNRMAESVNTSNAQLKDYEKATEEAKQRIEELTKELQSASKASEVTKKSLDPLVIPATTATTTRQSKKNNKKKKGGASARPIVGIVPSPRSESPQPSPTSISELETLRATVSQLENVIAEKALEVDKLSQQRKTEGDLREEIVNLEESLLATTQDFIEAKDKIKQLENEKTELQSQISKLEGELVSSAAIRESQAQLAANNAEVMKELEMFKTRSRAMQSDLEAAQKLAQDRFKNVTYLKGIVGEAQTQIKSLQQESTTLKTTQAELASRQNEIRNLEKQEKDLKNEVGRLKRQSSDHESEIKRLQSQLSTERTLKTKWEDEKRKMGRDYRRLESEKVEIVSRSEKTSLELETVQLELSTLRPKAKQLEDEVARLQKENNLAKEDVDLKTQQYNNAQGLLASMRDQSAELTVQLKEAQNQAESLAEELAEAQQHLTQRTRETESMRRMLAEKDGQADAKLRDMRSRMETAIEDRDRVEDESSTLARRRAREAEELRNKVRDLEREVKALSKEKDDLEAREGQWRRRREELEQIEEKATAETEDLRSTVSNLRSALDASEQQVRDVEKQGADLKKLLDEARGRYERTNKELKGLQSRSNLGNGSNVASSGRSSIDSTGNGFAGSNAKGISGGPDISYVKHIFLQFLEVRDEKKQSQLIPVLGKLLGFDKYDCLRRTP